MHLEPSVHTVECCEQARRSPPTSRLLGEPLQIDLIGAFEPSTGFLLGRIMTKEGAVTPSHRDLTSSKAKEEVKGRKEGEGEKEDEKNTLMG